MKKIFLTMLGILFVMLVSTSSYIYAQTETQIYLLDNMAKTILQIDETGNQTEYAINTTEDVYLGAFDLKFSTDGKRVAYCQIQQIEPAEYASKATLIVRDIMSKTDIHTIRLDNEAMGCHTSEFAQDNTLLAIGRVNYFPGTTQAENLNIPIWQLQVFDLTIGEVIAELNANTLTGDVATDLSNVAIVPHVVHLDENSLIFTVIPWAMGGPSELDAYQWNIGETNIESVPYWGKSGFDMLEATGEIIWVDWLQEFPAGQSTGPLGPFNVVMLTNEGMDEPAIIYYDAEWMPINSKFVAGGEKIAILLLESNAEPAKTRWIVIDRVQNVEEIGAFVAYSNLIGTNEGYAILETAYADENFSPPLTTQLKHVLDVVASTIWVNEAANPMFNWDIVWTNNPITMAENNLPRFFCCHGAKIISTISTRIKKSA